MFPSINSFVRRLKTRYCHVREVKISTLWKLTGLFVVTSLFFMQKSINSNPKQIVFTWSNNDIKKALLKEKFKETLSPLEPCENDGESVFMLVMVNSEVSNFKHRNAIRESWGSVSKVDKSVRLIFVIGKTQDPVVRESINLEKAVFNDILDTNVTEAYDKLTYKSIAILKWAHTHCSKTKYLIKVDDDIFFNIHRLMSELEKWNPKNSVIGCEESKNAPVRFFLFKWHVTREQYSADTYPVYITGPAYLITGDIISKLYRASFDVPYFFIEDIFVAGLCREKIGAKVVGHKEFSCSYRDRGPCGISFQEFIVGHHYYPEEMVRMWHELNNPSAQCRLVDYYWIATIIDILKGLMPF
ncbi:beta-1,3-galactosyltransferase 1-like [Saccostrea cucullata]|uniref:beta-1,3-galactosyltransferase 1-like n=1 Tax=Saccostrea cuccullata TaxID=36930 RepID=UPI002ED22A03